MLWSTVVMEMVTFGHVVMSGCHVLECAVSVLLLGWPAHSSSLQLCTKCHRTHPTF